MSILVSAIKRVSFQSIEFSLVPPKRMAHISRRLKSDYEAFAEVFNRSRRIVALTGAGTSAESGVPTFRGSGGIWRDYKSTSLATPEAFRKHPTRVWQFYEWRRQLVATKECNNAHKALAYLEDKFATENSGRSLWVITQNVDELHKQAGTSNLIELHGSLFKTRCTKCGNIESNYTNPIVPALANVSSSSLHVPTSSISEKDLPRCVKCEGLLRPHIVWFNEALWPEVTAEAEHLVDNADLLLVIGTSSVVYPACLYAPRAAKRGAVVAEFNLEETEVTSQFSFFFPGPCSKTLPKALNIEHLKANDELEGDHDELETKDEL